MSGFFIWTSPLKEAYVGTTPVKEIYVGTTKVRPTKKAFPYYTTSSSTILYCPLNEDLADKTGNYTMTASWSPTTGEYDGIDVTYFNKNYIKTTSNYTRNQTITVSCAVKKVWNWGSFCWQWQTSNPWERFIWTSSAYHWYSWSYYKTYTLNNDERYTITVVFPTSSSYPTVYINWVSTWSTWSFSWSRRWWCPIYIWWDWNWSSSNLQAYISNLIIENWDRWATKALNWHNTIKDYYGIN